MSILCLFLCQLKLMKIIKINIINIININISSNVIINNDCDIY